MPETNTTKSATLSQQLQLLASKYETESFLQDDPSRFLRHYTDAKDAELASFFAAMMSFGKREAFIPKIDLIFSKADEWISQNKASFYEWVTSREYRNTIENLNSDLEKKYYRFYSYSDIIKLFDCMNSLIAHQTFSMHFKELWEKDKSQDLADIIACAFSECKMVPHTKTSCKKRLYMYLRWMVRQNSPVDLGIWDWYPQSRLLLPLDTHVMQQAVKLDLLPDGAKADIKTARYLSAKMNEIFPGDPSRADFALFSLGVISDAD